MKKNKISKVFSVFGTIILIGALLITLIAVVQKITGKEILPYKLVWVMSASMEPDIKAESFILIEKTTDVKKGDIITFISQDPDLNGEYNTHEIVGINDDGTFQTQGKNNKFPDKYSVSKEYIIGKHIANLTILTIFGRFFQTKFGLVFILLTIIFIFLLISGIIKFKTKKQIHDEEIERRVKEEIEKLKQEALNNK